VQELLALMNEPVPAKPWQLSQAERVSITTRQTLETAAGELQSAGLKMLAKAVREYAANRPSKADLPAYPLGSINHTAWLAGMKCRRRTCRSLRHVD
jgi:hypothetical protein